MGLEALQTTACQTRLTGTVLTLVESRHQQEYNITGNSSNLIEAKEHFCSESMYSIERLCQP